MARVGNDLVITLRDGNQIRIGKFYQTGKEDSIHDVVLQDSTGNWWLADPKDQTNFCKVADWADLFDTVVHESGGGAILPLLGLGAGAAIIAASAGGGDKGPPRDTTPPAAPTAALVNDTGISNNDKITTDGTVRVTGIEPGAKVEYQIGNGPWVELTGDTFTLPSGTHQTVNVRQTDAAGNVSPVTNIGPITVDNVPPAALTGALVADTGASNADKITSNGAVTVGNIETGARVEYQIGTGAWTTVTGSSFTLPEGQHQTVNIRQTDVAGNISSVTNIGPITVDTTAPSAPAGVLAEDTGLSGVDKITKNGTVNVTGTETGALVQYQVGEGAWTTVSGGSFILPEGTHQTVNLRQTDAAGNVSGVVNIGPITVDNVAPGPLAGDLVTDSGADDADRITNDPTVQLTGIETGALVEYQIDGGAWTQVSGGQFELPEGTSAVVNVRQTDVAGNVGPTINLGTFTVDTQAPGPLTAELENDTGAEDDDGITNDGTINVGGVEEGNIVEYSPDGGETWIEVELDDDGNFILPEGEYEEVLVRQVDEAGNASEPVSLGPITVDTTPPGTVSGALENDSGPLDDDNYTNDGTVLVTGGETGATLQYQIGGGAWEDVVGGQFDLPEGVHPVVNVRQVDLAGNAGEPINIGPITVDQTNPDAPVAGLADDTGAEDDDGITNNGQINITISEPNALIEYQVDGGNWVAVTGTSFTLEPGEYGSVNVRQTDLAGNVSQPTSLGAITVDVSAPPQPTAELVEDTGSSTIDKITRNGEVEITSPDVGATVEYRVDGGEWIEVEGSSFTLDEGEYDSVEIRQTDAAGNSSTAIDIGPITVDQTPPEALSGQLVTDNGSDDDDNISSEGEILLNGYEAGAIVEYSVNGTDWTAAPVLEGVITLPPGVYEDLQIRQTDVAGNVGESTTIGDFTIIDADPIDAIDDDFSVDLGTINIVVHDTDTTYDFDVFEFADGTSGVEMGKTITVADGSRGELHVVVQQSSIGALGNAFAVELYDSDGNLVYRATMPDAPYFGDAPGGGFLGLIGDGALEATFPDLEPGEYTVVVVSDSGAMNNLVQGLEFSDIGLDGTILGPSNEQLIIDAVDEALSDSVVTDVLGGNPVLANLVTGVIQTSLDLAGGTPLPDFLNTLNSGLKFVGATAIADFITDAIADAFLSNFLSFFQQTILETTLAEYSYALEPVEGNVFADNENGADDVNGVVTVISATYDDPDIANDPPQAVANGAPAVIQGEYGILTLYADGSFEYVPDGNPDSIGQVDVFTYTISNGLYQDTAQLRFDFTGNAPPIPNFVAVDDVNSLDMGEVTFDTPVEFEALNVQVLEWLPNSFSPQNGLKVTVGADRSASMEIAIEQQALFSAAPAFRVDVFNAFGEIVHTAVAANSFFGDAPGLSLFGYDGGNRLTTSLDGLPAGDYYIVVSNAESALVTVIDGLSLADLGDGAVLGAENQAIILTAVEQFLTTNLSLPEFLADPVILLLDGIIGIANYGTPLAEVIDDIVDLLGPVPGAMALLDDFIDDLSAALISNYFSALEFTSIEATVYPYDFPNEDVSGNVLTGGAGADDVPSGTLVRYVTNEDDETVSVYGNQSAVIRGKYGILTLSQDGSYTYEAYGDPGSIGKSDIFTYGISYFNRTDTATLTIEIEGDSINLQADFSQNEMPFMYQFVDNFYLNTANYVGAIFPNDSVVAEFTIAANVREVLGEISVGIIAAANQTVTIIIEKQNGGNWDAVANGEFEYPILLGAVGSLPSINLEDLDLTPGTYRVFVSNELSAGASTLIISTEVDLVLNDLVANPYLIDYHAGQLIENDKFGSLNFALSVRAEGGGELFEADADGVDVQGLYGKLTVYADGSYQYITDTNLLPSNVALAVDPFVYRVTLPSGEYAEEQLSIVHGYDVGDPIFFAPGDTMSLASLIDGYVDEEPDPVAPPPPADPVDPLSYLETPQQDDLHQPAYV